MYCLKKAGQLIKIGDAIAAISFDAFNCSLAPLHEKIHSLKGLKGQVETADVVRKYLEGSQLTNTENLDNQDPYCFRCIPQVHGATKDTFSYVLSIFLKEINSVTDDPPIFYEDNLIANGGNFHDQPLALALNFFSAAMRALAIISTGRTNKLINGKKGLGVVLKNGSESNDGLKMLQHAANSVISENKSLFEPAVGDGISAYNIEEDQVMAGADAGTKCLQVIQNVERVLAIELIAAAQVVEFRRPLRSSDILEQILMHFHKQVPLNDRAISDNDILKTTAFVSSHAV
jgi:histidine ammonia-lyase